MIHAKVLYVIKRLIYVQMVLKTLVKFDLGAAN